MPHTKEYKGKKGHSTHSTSHHKRRPRHEMKDNTEKLSEVAESEETVYDGAEAINTEALNEGVFPEGHSQVYVAPDENSEESPAEKAFEAAYEEPASSYSESTNEKIHLEFYGSDLLRTKAPQVMELADTVVDEWVKDGQFQGLPVGNPIAQIAAAKALRKAKDVEKKLEEKGVFIMAKMGFDYLKSKIDRK